jgi:low affinity Fe/Cu permease
MSDIPKQTFVKIPSTSTPGNSEDKSGNGEEKGKSKKGTQKKGAWYSQFAQSASRFCGRPKVFACALAVIVVWAVSGPIFGYSDTWQLVINTGTTIITFLMVFLIQNTQNRDTEAMQIKLDELIRATQGAHNALLDLEELDDKKLDAFRKKYEALAQAAREQSSDTDTPPA